MAQKNIINPTTGQTGYQIPGAALQPGWQYITNTPASPIVPTAPAAPTVAPPSTSNVASLNAARAAAVNAGQSPYAGNLQNSSTFSAAAPTTPPVPTQAASAMSAAPATGGTATDNTVLKQLLAAMTPTSTETDLQKKLIDTEASRRLSYRDLEGQPIATPFITGQEAAVGKSIDATEANLTDQLTLEQKKRQASIDASKAYLDYTKPTTLGAGSNLYNPLTGEQLTQNTSVGNQTADQKNYAAATAAGYTGTFNDYQERIKNLHVGQGMQFDPVSGQFVTYQTSGPAVAGLSSGGGSGGSSGAAPSSGGSNFGTSGGASLDVGSSGANVTALQQWLISQGYSIPAGATGYYGDQTRAAVEAFQRANGVDLSGGGAGTFGPKTSAAASTKGFSLQGTLGGGSPQGTPVSGSQIPPQISAAYSKVGGVGYFDMGKLNTQQVPLAQRTSSQLGIPLLQSADANKIQESYQSFQSANALVDQISKLTQGVLTATNDAASMTQQAARLKLIELAPNLSTDDQAKQFVSARNSILSLITRAAGEKGTLTDTDVGRIKDALPAYGDHAELAKQKAANLTSVLKSVFDGSIAAYIGTASGGTGTSTNFGTPPSSGGNDEYTKYLQSIGITP